jgi:hypothetical protein
MNPMSIVEAANGLIANQSKMEIVAMARSYGWRGDHARAPMLQLALYVATKLASEEKLPDAGAGMGDGQGQQSPDGQQDSQGETKQGESEGQQDDQQDSQEAQGQQDSQEAQGQPKQDETPQERFEREMSEAKARFEAEQDRRQREDQEARAKYEADMKQAEEQARQQQGQQGQQEQPKQEPSNPENEFADLLKASGIDKPHVLLEKAWRLTTKARVNLMLVGPAGAGKTILAQQLAQLIRVPFGSVSCSMGMSESQLTGWLLPVGDAGRFEYVSSPLVTCLQQPSVFLLDELDAADGNVLMSCNSLLANGFISIPHRLGNPLVQRDADSIIVAGCNTVGNGADDMYSARGALDGSTLDRFYCLAVDYDRAYQKSLFVLPGVKSRIKSVAWQPATQPVTQDVMNELHVWFCRITDRARDMKMQKIVSTRLAQKLIGACLAGVPVQEVKADLLSSWTADEITRVGGL